MTWKSSSTSVISFGQSAEVVEQRGKDGFDRRAGLTGGGIAHQRRPRAPRSAAHRSRRSRRRWAGCHSHRAKATPRTVHAAEQPPATLPAASSSRSRRAPERASASTRPHGSGARRAADAARRPAACRGTYSLVSSSGAGRDPRAHVTASVTRGPRPDILRGADLLWRCRPGRPARGNLDTARRPARAHLGTCDRCPSAAFAASCCPPCDGLAWLLADRRVALSPRQARPA